jgi:hypothetical protein
MATTAAETANNEIKFESFIFQAKNLEETKKILDIKERCYIETSGWFGKTKTKVNSFSNDAYLALYDYLVDKGIITKSVESASFFTLESVYRLNKSSLEHFEKFKKSLSMNDHPTILKCYTINYKNLHTFLKNYKYTITPVDIVVGGKRRNKTNCSKNRKNKKTKRKL